MKKDVVIGGKDTTEVDNDFFLVVVKIFDHQQHSGLLAMFLDVNSDVPALAVCVRAQATVPEGYQILIDSMAASG
ncbi:hypothetical protein L1987_60407 [Smallanthus sonchifolius]|uniref:Uncharacterized protein n=1 Tax=Smallanthus sonchifolius TaxID=185202 RepID=A0ACB9D8L2_9ASTR|nr:hypothetical protein L1987_60407 [Smallanthus sonchifolius]